MTLPEVDDTEFNQTKKLIDGVDLEKPLFKPPEVKEPRSKTVSNQELSKRPLMPRSGI